MGKSKDMKRERLCSPFNWIWAYRPLAVLWPVNIWGAAVRGERAWPPAYIFTLLRLHTGQQRLSLLWVNVQTGVQPSFFVDEVEGFSPPVGQQTVWCDTEQSGSRVEEYLDFHDHESRTTWMISVRTYNQSCSYWVKHSPSKRHAGGGGWILAVLFLLLLRLLSLIFYKLDAK